MKKWMLGGIFMLLLPWLLALACMTGTGQAVWGSEERMEEEEDLRPSPDGEEDNEKEAETEEAKASAAGISRRILIERDGISTYMNLEDYLPGVVVCQIPEEYEREALKCQTVIARTYICRLMDGRQEISEEELDLDYLGQINEKENRFLTIGEKERLAERLIQCKKAAEETKGVVMRWGSSMYFLFFTESAQDERETEPQSIPILFLQKAGEMWRQKIISRYFPGAEKNLRRKSVRFQGRRLWGQSRCRNRFRRLKRMRPDI